jgi:hypothetical protein
MNVTLELLNYIYQNARKGVIILDDLKVHVDDIKLKECIVEEYKDYDAICDEAINCFIKIGHNETDLSTMVKVNTYLMININTLNDSSSSNIARMLINNSNRGIKEITEKLNFYYNSDINIKKLGNKLLKTEQKNLECLKKFL